MKQVSKRVYRTNYYNRKGLLQIELRTHQFIHSKKKTDTAKHYLVLRCNAGMIMGDNKHLALDLEKYTKEQILEKLQRRIYEVNEFRILQLHKYPIQTWKANRVDIAKDIFDTNPMLAVFLCNQSFPYNYQKMKRITVNKGNRILLESCYFGNMSRTVNIYYKLAAVNDRQIVVDDESLELLDGLLRVEIQIKKKGIYNMTRGTPNARSIEPFLADGFCQDYLKKEMLSIFGAEKYVSTAAAKKLIMSSQHSPYEKNVLLSIIKLVHVYGGLYELEKAISDSNVYTPAHFGNLKTFRDRWLKKIRKLGFNPATIPAPFGVMEFPSIYELLAAEKS